VPDTGIYTFDMVVASGGKLTIHDQTVIDADGDRSVAQYTGSIALKAGLHPVRMEYYHGAPVRQERLRQQADDFLQLFWAGPGLPRASVPAAAFFRKGDGHQPSLIAKARMLGDATIELRGQLDGAKATRMAYYAVNENFSLFAEQGANQLDYLLAETERPTESVQACIWGGPRKTIRARAFLEDGSTIDSAPITVQSAVPPVVDANGMKLSELEYHIYPAARDVTSNGVTLVGDSMTLLTRPHKGDVTIVARVADLIIDKPMGDGTGLNRPYNWFSGIILRNNTDAKPGAPLGGPWVPFIAVMVNASEDLLWCDSTRINGAGNQPVGLGKMEGSRWLKITRKGQTFSAFVSKDGTAWKMVKTMSLPTTSSDGAWKIPAMNEEIEVGFVQYSLPNSTPRIQWSKFDNLSIKDKAE
jgi:hypothetical protein